MAGRTAKAPKSTSTKQSAVDKPYHDFARKNEEWNRKAEQSIARLNGRATHGRAAAA